MTPNVSATAQAEARSLTLRLNSTNFKHLKQQIMYSQFISGSISENPYNIKIGGKVIVKNGNLPILTVSRTLGRIVFFEEITDTFLTTECSPKIKLTKNGGGGFVLTAEQYDFNRDYFRKGTYLVDLIS